MSGYDGGDWLRAEHRINLHICDHRRISAQLTHADDEHTTGRLLHALTDLARHASDLPPARPVPIPDPAHLRLEQVMLPRDAFFGPTEQVLWREAAGRITAEMLTPYPPGIPVAVPGERLTADVLDYLHTGIDTGMVMPDAADPRLDSVRVATDPPCSGTGARPPRAPSSLSRLAAVPRRCAERRKPRSRSRHPLPVAGGAPSARSPVPVR